MPSMHCYTRCLKTRSKNYLMSAGNEAAYLLSWSPVAGAVSYNIKRSTVSGSETTIATSAVTHYTDNGLVNGTTYYYEVSAVDGCSDESANSEEENVTPEYASAPVFTGGFIGGDSIYANNILAQGGTTPYSPNSFTFYVSGPPNSTSVSYTHLDVYKRQDFTDLHRLNP